MTLVFGRTNLINTLENGTGAENPYVEKLIDLSDDFVNSTLPLANDDNVSAWNWFGSSLMSHSSSLIVAD